MNAPNIQTNIIKDLANKYSEIQEQFLIQGLGREPSIDEFAAFIETVVANIFGGMYGILREEKGPQEAEAWMKRTLSVTSALVRMRGSDAILKFEVSVKEVPNTLHKKQMAAEPAQNAAGKEPAAPAAVPPPSPCNCTRDAHGRCPKCVATLGKYFQDVVEPFMRMTEVGEQIKGMCNVCQLAHMDYAMSTIVPALHKMAQGSGPDQTNVVFQKILVSLFTIASMMGARELPITNKVYSDMIGAQPKA